MISNHNGELVLPANGHTATPTIVRSGNDDEAEHWDGGSIENVSDRVLAVRAARSTAEPALIQNGSDPTIFSDGHLAVRLSKYGDSDVRQSATLISQSLGDADRVSRNTSS